MSMELSTLRNEALQLGMTFTKSNIFRLPNVISDGDLTVTEVDCMTGDMYCTNGQIINCSREHSGIITKVYQYIVNLLTTNKSQSV